jgi:anthranilate phosphoribosyltransferase
LNPVRPTAQLLGVPQPELCLPLAQVLKQLGSRRVMVVSGSTPEGHLDELSTLGASTISEFYQDRGFHSSTMDPIHFNLQPVSLAQLRGGDRKENAFILKQILSSTERGPKRDAVLLNSAAALFVAGKVKSLAAGIDLATEVIDTGKALAKLNELAKYRP